MEFLKFLEKIRLPFFDKFFSLITNIGGEIVFMVLSITVFWCFSKKYGYYILSVGFFGTVINQFLKLAFRIPRPWVKDPDFTIVESARADATGYSFPSGHTQNSVGTFGSIAYVTDKKWLRYVSIALIVLVPFSRMYLGVHTPLDVCVSFVIAALLVFAVRPLIEKGDKNPKLMYMIFCAMFVLSAALVMYTELFPFPADTDVENLASGIKNAYTLLGVTAGILIAFPIEKKYINFDVSGKWYVQIIKTVVGLLLLLGIRTVLKAPLNFIFGGHAVSNSVRYAVMIIFAVDVWPLTFNLIKNFFNKEV